MLKTVRIKETREVTKTYDVDYDFEALEKAQKDYYNGKCITNETPCLFEVILED